MENSLRNNTNSRKQTSNNSRSSSSSSNADYQEELDGINYDFDWNTEYGDGDIPDIDHRI